jgi:hypothetical protein
MVIHSGYSTHTRIDIAKKQMIHMHAKGSKNKSKSKSNPIGALGNTLLYSSYAKCMGSYVSPRQPGSTEVTPVAPPLPPCPPPLPSLTCGIREVAYFILLFPPSLIASVKRPAFISLRGWEEKPRMCPTPGRAGGARGSGSQLVL